jgi:signal peptidase
MKNKKIFTIIKSVFFYTITFYLLAYIIVNLFMPEKAIHVFGYQVTSISRLTESMKPNILPGDVIVIKSVDETDIDEGDIISFYTYVQGIDRNQNLVWVKIKVVHRVIDINEENQSYITKGDNNNDIDVIRNAQGEEIDLTYDQIIGEYAYRIPVLGTIATALRNPIMIGLVLVNVTIIVVIVKLIKQKDKEPTPEEEKNL